MAVVKLLWADLRARLPACSGSWYHLSLCLGAAGKWFLLANLYLLIESSWSKLGHCRGCCVNAWLPPLQTQGLLILLIPLVLPLDQRLTSRLEYRLLGQQDERMWKGCGVHLETLTWSWWARACTCSDSLTRTPCLSSHYKTGDLSWCRGSHHLQQCSDFSHQGDLCGSVYQACIQVRSPVHRAADLRLSPVWNPLWKSNIIKKGSWLPLLN